MSTIPTVYAIEVDGADDALRAFQSVDGALKNNATTASGAAAAFRKTSDDISDSFKKAKNDAGVLGSTVASALGGAVDDLAGMAAAIAGGGVGAVAGSIVGALALATKAWEVYRTEQGRARKQAEEVAAAVDAVLASIQGMAQGSADPFSDKSAQQLRDMATAQGKVVQAIEIEIEKQRELKRIAEERLNSVSFRLTAMPDDVAKVIMEIERAERAASETMGRLYNQRSTLRATQEAELQKSFVEQVDLDDKAAKDKEAKDKAAAEEAKRKAAERKRLADDEFKHTAQLELTRVQIANATAEARAKKARELSAVLASLEMADFNRIVARNEQIERDVLAVEARASGDRRTALREDLEFEQAVQRQKLDSEQNVSIERTAMLRRSQDANWAALERRLAAEERAERASAMRRAGTADNVIAETLKLDEEATERRIQNRQRETEAAVEGLQRQEEAARRVANALMLNSVATEAYGVAMMAVGPAINTLTSQLAVLGELNRENYRDLLEVTDQTPILIAKQIQAMLAGIAQQAAAKALFEGAEAAKEVALAIGSAAMYDAAGASMHLSAAAAHGASAAAYAALGGGAAGGALGIGLARPATREEKERSQDERGESRRGSDGSSGSSSRTGRNSMGGGGGTTGEFGVTIIQNNSGVNIQPRNAREAARPVAAAMRAARQSTYLQRQMGG